MVLTSFDRMSFISSCLKRGREVLISIVVFFFLLLTVRVRTYVRKGEKRIDIDVE